MSLKVKLVSFISVFILVLSLMLISVFAATNVTLNIGGNVSFTANSVNALITGSIAGNAAGGSTLTTIDIDASDPDGPVSMPPDWTSMDLTFTESASPITVTINIQNRSTDREIAVSLTDSTNISNVAVTRECDGTSINASDNRNIPGGETITYTFELNVQSQNSSANGAFDLTIGLETPGPQTYEYFTFEENEDGKTVTLTDYKPSLSDSTDITIPATVDLVDGVWQDGNTYTVTAITDGSYNPGVFYDSGITSVTFPSSLTSIGNNAFSGCSGLTSISLPSSLTSIGNSAFSGCSGLTGELNLGGCTSLTSIEGAVFMGCSELTGIVTIPASVTDIETSNPFYGCTKLEGIVVEEGNSEYYIEGNCLIENSTKTLITGFNNSTILSDIKVIEERAFGYCNGLTSISLPSSLKAIGISAFADCSGLTSVDLSGCTSLTSIGMSAFWSCSGLTSISLPSSLTDIGSNAFYNCSSLTEVIIDSPDIYKDATSASACGGLLQRATTIKVLTNLVSDSHAYINSTNFNVTNEEIGGKNYTVYSK